MDYSSFHIGVEVVGGFLCFIAIQGNERYVLSIVIGASKVRKASNKNGGKADAGEISSTNLKDVVSGELSEL